MNIKFLYSFIIKVQNQALNVQGSYSNAEQQYTNIITKIFNSILTILPVMLSCPECQQKDNLIDKYLKLIKLLKTKCEKNTKSYTKSNTSPSENIYETQSQKSKSLLKNKAQDHAYSKLNPEKYTNQQPKNSQLNLAFKIISNKCQKALLKHSFQKIRHFITQSDEAQPFFGSDGLDLQCSIASVIQQTLNFGRQMQQKNKINFIHFKQFHKQIFHLNSQNSVLRKQIDLLQKQFKESQKRFIKQTQKKRESLQMVAEEMRQKTQLVIQLQQTIKKYEKALGKNIHTLTVENMLVEDVDEIKKTSTRLQNINQKLNDDIRNLKITNQDLKKQLNSMSMQNLRLKQQNKAIKQQNFELLHQSPSKDEKMQKVYKYLLKKFNSKIQILQIKQKQLQNSLKANSNMVWTKSSQMSAGEICMEQKQSIKELHVQQKIEEVFAFLFHIQNENYRIDNCQLFDQEQLALLNFVKENYLHQAKQTSFLPVKRESIQKPSSICGSFANTDEMFYIKKPELNQDDSFLCAMDPIKMQTQKQSKSTSRFDNMKLIQLEIQKSKLVEKISQLKNLHMHIRNVIFNFLKVLDLSHLRPQCGGILEIILQFFEYSEDEKGCIFKQKKKKFWGLL